MQRMQEQHRRQLLETHKKGLVMQQEQQREISVLKKWIDKACKWFPLFADAFLIEKLCNSVGFTSEQTDRLLTLKPMEYRGIQIGRAHV